MNLRFLILGIFVLSINMLNKVNAQDEKGIQNFTVTDIYSQKHELFKDYLDNGKYVYLNFFQPSCGGCQFISPIVDTVSRDYGCNSGDIIFLGIGIGINDNSDVWTFTEEYQMSYPAVSSTEGGGWDVGQLYEIPYTPWKMLLSPDKQIVINEFFFNTSIQLKDTLTQVIPGLTEKTCDGNEFLFYGIIANNDTMIAEIDNINNKLTVQVPFGIDISNNTAVFRNSPNSIVTINGVGQESLATLNDFTQNTVYRITSESGNINDMQLMINYVAKIDKIESEIMIFPNPCDEYFIIDLANNNASIKLINLSGQAVFNKTLKEKQSRINISELPTGIYFAEIETEGYKITKKLVVK